MNRLILLTVCLLAMAMAGACSTRSIAQGRNEVDVSGTRFRITSVDYAPEDLYGQVPVHATLIRRVPGPDRSDYWLAELQKPIAWMDGEDQRSITHIIVSSRYVGETIDNGFERLVIGVAYVTDPTLLSDQTLAFEKCRYVAIGVAERVAPGA